jgi:hypothetical protein
MRPVIGGDLGLKLATTRRVLSGFALAGPLHIKPRSIELLSVDTFGMSPLMQFSGARWQLGNV